MSSKGQSGKSLEKPLAHNCSFRSKHDHTRLVHLLAGRSFEILKGEGSAPRIHARGRGTRAFTANFYARPMSVPYETGRLSTVRATIEKKDIRL